MATTLAQKLRIKEGFRLVTLNAPVDFLQSLDGLPQNVKVGPPAETFDQIHWFVKTKAAMEEELPAMLSMLTGDTVCWIYYPKGTSKIQTDLTRDKGWEALLKHNALQWISLISFNDTWSAFGMRRQTESDRKKGTAPKTRPIFDYIDPVKKAIFLPEDLAAALKEAKAEAQFFNSLSFTNRKEYVEWLVSARREETRSTRVRETVERLGKGWKNPANR
jgi:hypothetical protein